MEYEVNVKNIISKISYMTETPNSTVYIELWAGTCLDTGHVAPESWLTPQMTSSEGDISFRQMKAPCGGNPVMPLNWSGIQDTSAMI